MANFPPVNYIRDAGRTEAEMKDALENWLATTKQLPGATTQTTLTLVSHQITPTGPSHLVDTQGGASTDNLAQILTSTLPDGSYLMLGIVANARTVVVKHAAGGAGQISLVGGVDFTLSSTTTFLYLQRNGTQWEERGRWFGTNNAAFRAFYQVAGLGQNTFTGRQEQARGASIASASTLTIGTDGNFFHVTGTTSITNISVAPAGTKITLAFDSILTIVHNATNLILPGGSNITTQAGLTLPFVSEGAGIWRLESGASGDATVVLDRQTADVAVAGTLAETQVYSFSVPGGTLGTNKRLSLNMMWWENNNTAGVNFYVVKLYFGGVLMHAIEVYLQPNGTVGGGAGPGEIRIQVVGWGATNVQLGHIERVGQLIDTGTPPLGGEFRKNGAVYSAGSADSTAAQLLTITVQLSANVGSFEVRRRHAVLTRE